MLPAKPLSDVLHEWAKVFMRRSVRDFKRFMDESGLSLSQVTALMRLHHLGDCGVSDLSEHIGISRAAASQMTERLVQMGLLARTENPTDRRAKQLSLTPKGKALIQEGIEARRQWLADLTNALPPAEQATISQALTALTEAARRLENQTEPRRPF